MTSAKKAARLGLGCLILGQFCAPCVQAQDEKKAAGAIQITFLPPPLEHATYSLGIYDAKADKLVRHLQEFAPEKDFTVGLNGLITIWDGKDDAGKPVPAGSYAARGYAVGALKIEGIDILGNDWAEDDEPLRIKGIDAIAENPEDDGLLVLAYGGGDVWKVLRYGGDDVRLLWQKEPGPLAWTARPAENSYPNGTLAIAGDHVVVTIGGNTLVYRLADGATVPPSSPAPAAAPASPDSNPGKNGSVWKIEDGVLFQLSATGEKLRSLPPVPGEPVPQAVTASTQTDRLYLLERMEGWQRVRGLSWIETKAENGHPVSTWKTFFERNIRRPEASGAGVAATPVEVNLDENPLSPGKPQKIRLTATFDARGSYLTTEGGLRLRRISERSNLQSAHLAKGKTPSPIDFFQYDGAATDEFSISGVHRIMAFDAGEFELTATGEKPADTKTAEPPDL